MAKRQRKVNSLPSTPQTWQEAMEEYLLYKKAEGLRDITIKGHSDVIKLFYKRHPNAYNSNEELKKAAYAFFGEKISSATYNIRRNYLRQFFNWCVERGIYLENPIAHLKKRKASPHIVQLDPEILAKLLKLPDKKTYAGLRDYALLLFFLDTGARPNEAFQLLIKNFNFRAGKVHIPDRVAKDKEGRTLPLSPVTIKAIKDLIAARHPEWKDEIPVFCSTDGTTLALRAWEDRMKMYSDQLGVRIRPYDLRHAFALQFLRNGGHALALKDILGHSTLQMTSYYVALTQRDLKQQHTLATPLNTLVTLRQRVRKVKRER